MPEFDKYIRANRAIWEQKAAAHFTSRFYDVAGFKCGQSSLNQLERLEVGKVRGKRLLHLQCHFGLDTLSWARLGARVTGVDFSTESIRFGKKLAAELAIPAQFICSDVYQLRRHLRGKFDVVYISYGCLGWLPDLRRWAKIVAHFLAPGGRLHLIEFHPVYWMFDGPGPVVFPYDSGDRPIVIRPQGTYAAPEAKIKGHEYWYNHGLESTVEALLQSGLRLTGIRHHNYSPYKIVGSVPGKKKGQWVSKDFGSKVPILFSLIAEAPVV